MKRKFGKTFRLSADSHEDIAAEFNDIANGLGRAGVKYVRYKLRPGPLLNAMALHVMKLSEAERKDFAVSVLADLEVFMAQEEGEGVSGKEQPKKGKAPSSATAGRKVSHRKKREA